MMDHCKMGKLWILSDALRLQQYGYVMAFKQYLTGLKRKGEQKTSPTPVHHQQQPKDRLGPWIHAVGTTFSPDLQSAVEIMIIEISDFYSSPVLISSPMKP